MIKIDKPIVEKFLGTTDVNEFISKLKFSRLYYKNTGNIEDTVLILTPIMKEDGEYLNNLIEAQKIGGHPCVATEHKVGRNYAYTFKKIKKS